MWAPNIIMTSEMFVCPLRNSGIYDRLNTIHCSFCSRLVHMFCDDSKDPNYYFLVVSNMFARSSSLFPSTDEHVKDNGNNISTDTSKSFIISSPLFPVGLLVFLEIVVVSFFTIADF